MRRVNAYDLEEARRTAGLSLARTLEELDISERTWHRWMRKGEAPVWAFRLIHFLSGDLTRLGWKNWQIRGGVLYYNELHYRYHWTPTRLVLPLYNVTESDAAWQQTADNLTSIETLRAARDELETRKTKYYRRIAV